MLQSQSLDVKLLFTSPTTVPCPNCGQAGHWELLASFCLDTVDKSRQVLTPQAAEDTALAPLSLSTMKEPRVTVQVASESL